MTANHRVQAGRRPAAEDPLSATTTAPAGRAPSGRDASLDWRISVPGVPAIVALTRQLVRAALEDCPRRDDIERRRSADPWPPRPAVACALPLHDGWSRFFIELGLSETSAWRAKSLLPGAVAERT